MLVYLIGSLGLVHIVKMHSVIYLLLKKKVQLSSKNKWK
ncbi:hypothetical protein HU200_033085 [Digitaria exilis]|uniref:Uncharacterized protein n=1 Tax=Digitaria exilis TaxID=1010633 RepID=A0A835BM29_9POAL|nr:hypothetical protein HU200_033085 [Digitaria exilis]